MATHSSTLAWRIPWTEEPGGLLSMGSHRVGHNWSDLACAHALEKETATHFSILIWKIPGTEPSGLPSMGSHRVGHDWSDLAAAAAWGGIIFYHMALCKDMQIIHFSTKATLFYQDNISLKNWQQMWWNTKVSNLSLRIVWDIQEGRV